MTTTKALTISRSTFRFSQESLQQAWDVLDTEPQTREVLSAKDRLWGALYEIFNAA